MTYTEKSTQLALESSVAALVLLGTDRKDSVFLPLRPNLATPEMLADLKSRAAGRGLRAVGIIGLCGTTPKMCLKEELDPAQINAISLGFLAYTYALFAENAVAGEVAELERIYSLPDTRLN